MGEGIKTNDEYTRAVNDVDMRIKSGTIVRVDPILTDVEREIIRCMALCPSVYGWTETIAGGMYDPNTDEVLIQTIPALCRSEAASHEIAHYGIDRQQYRTRSLLHELSHATGSKKRLFRNTIHRHRSSMGDSITFFEEVIADRSAVICMRVLGIASRGLIDACKGYQRDVAEMMHRQHPQTIEETLRRAEPHAVKSAEWILGKSLTRKP